jgi:hypothetical protein
MKRIVTSVLMAAGLVLTSAMARPVPWASADTLHCDVGLSVVLNVLGVAPAACGLGLDPGTGTYCRLTNVDVNLEADSGAYGYQFDLIDGTIGPCNMHVQGSYNPSTHLADEKLTGSGRVEAIWLCSDDPWTFLPGQAPSCQNRSLLAVNADGTAPDLPNMTFPVSAQTLIDSDRHVLNAQLQNALNAYDAQSKAAQTATTIGHVSNSACVPCVTAAAAAQPAAPTLPDLAITAINGPKQVSQGFSYTYDVILSNLGAEPAGQVQVEIQVTGSLRYLQMLQTPNGFTCLGAGPIICTGPIGGNGDAPITTVADFQFQVQAAQVGVGSISADANPNNTTQESNTDNNAQTLAVTVK